MMSSGDLKHFDVILSFLLSFALITHCVFFFLFIHVSFLSVLFSYLVQRDLFKKRDFPLCGNITIGIWL